MSLKTYNRVVVRSTDVGCWIAFSFAALIWIATIADHSLRLGCGWNVQNIWLAPIIMAGALLTRFLSRLIFKWVGAND